MIEPYENNGILSVRVGPNLKAAIEELGDVLKKETESPSVNAGLVVLLRKWVEERRDLLSKRARFNFLFDQMPRAGRK